MRTRIFDYAVQQLRTRYQIDLRADRLDYNLLARRITLTGVRLAAQGHERDPFFTAQRMQVVLPWTIFKGIFSFQQIEVSNAAVTMLRFEDGSSNVPASGEPENPNRPPLKLDIRGLAIDTLDFAYRDRVRGLSIEAGGLGVDLDWRATGAVQGIMGPVQIRQGVRVRAGERQLVAQPVAGLLAFDGSNIVLEDVKLETAEAALVINGRLDRALDRPALDLRFDGNVDVGRAAAWGTVPVALGGQSRVAGTISGPAAAPTIRVQTDSNTLAVGDVSGLEAKTQITLTADALVVDKATVRAEGGSADLVATVPFGEDRPLQVGADWRNLRALTIVRLLNQPERPVGSTLTGTLRAERSPHGALTMRVENRAEPDTSAGAVPIAGRLSAQVDRGEWRLVQEHSVPGALSTRGELGGRVDGTAFSTASIAGTLHASVDDVARAAQVLGRFGVAVPAAAADVHGPVVADANLDGRVDALQARATIDSGGLSLPGLASAVVHAEVEATPEVLRVGTLTAAIGTVSLTAQADINLRSRQLAGSMNLDASNVADLLAGTSNAGLVEGPLEADVTLGGTLAHPDVRATASAERLTVQGQVIDSLSLQARVEDQQVYVDALEARQGEGELSGKGTYRWSTQAYTADLAGSNLSWSGALIGSTESTVRVSMLRYAGEGTIERPGGQANLAFEIAGGMAGSLVGEGTATAELTGDAALITARVPSLGALVNAKILTRAPYTYDATAVVNEVDLAALSPLAGAPAGSVVGHVSLSAAANGSLSDAAASSAFVNLQEVAAKINDVPVSLTAPARLAWQQSALKVDGLDLQLGQGRLQAAGELARSGAKQWDASFNGQLGDLVRMAQPFGAPADLVASGAITARWQSSAGPEASTAAVQLEGGTLSLGRAPPISALTLKADFDGQTINVPTLTGVWQEGGIDGTASIPRALLDSTAASPTSTRAPGHARLRVTNLSAEAFEPWLGRETLARLQGQLSASLDAEISGTSINDVEATLTLDEAAYTVAGIEVQQARPSRITLARGIVTLEDVAWAAGGSPLSFTGTVALTPADARTLDVGVAGEVNLRIASAFLPEVVTDGSATIDLRASGTLADPRLAGRLQLTDAGLALRDPRIVVSEVSGPIVLDGDAIIFDGIGGTVNGGALTLDGRLRLDGMSVAGGSLVAQLQQVAMELPEGLQSEVSALLTLSPSEDDWVLGGDVRIERSAYTDPISIAAIAAARRSRPPVASSGPSGLERLRLNLFVVTEEDLRVDNNYGQLEAGAAVRVVGTAAQPGLTGRVTLREGGEFYLAGNTFYIEQGSISFTNPSRIEPEIDLQARALVGGTDLTLTVSGPLDELKTDVRGQNSQGTVSDREAREALFGGLVGDEQALTLLSAEVLGVTGRAIGLDSLRVERGFDSNELRADPTLIATETDPSARLTLSKRLRPEVEFVLSQSLRESGDLSAIISYKPRRNIELRAISRDNIDRSFAVRHEVTFGGGGSDGRPASLQPRVTAVRIEGETGRPAQEIRGNLRLEEGDRFDFHKLQRDVDDIRDSYYSDGFYEARVRAGREVSADQETVALDFRIDRGPRTSLTIEGHVLHDDLRRELEDVWKRVVFDQFLVDEIESRIQRHLLAENYVGSRVEAQVAIPTEDQKELRVTIAPGVQVARREVRYAGNDAIGADELDALLQGAQLQVEGWLNPPRLTGAIESLYRERGYLAARATAGEPTVDGTVGVLTVVIEEGPRFTFANTSIAGVGDARRPPALEIIRTLGDGTPYDRAAVDRVAAEIEASYQRQGFNDARVETRAEVNTGAGTVAVTFDVQEGRQQILRAVTTEGATRTRGGVIGRALRLEVGQPVDLAQWAQSRKRMYDTNVFRQVDLEPGPMEPTPEDVAANVQPVRAVVRVVEYPAWRLRYGGQYRDEIQSEDEDEFDVSTRRSGFGVLADLQNRNLFGRAVAGGVAGSFQPGRQATSLFAQTGSFFGLPVRTNGFLFGVRETDRPNDFFSVVNDRTGVSVEQRWRPFGDAELSYGYRFERLHTFDPDPAPDDPNPLDTSFNVARVTSALFIDRRDDPFNATAGWFSSANWDHVAQALGSFYSTRKLLVQQFYYREVGPLVLASAARYGIAFNVQNISREDRFLAGGGTTVRGYAEDGLGPRDTFGRARGGAALLIVNQEVRFPIFKWVGGVAFIDAGNVYERRADLSFGNLELGYGFGLRLSTPFALLRADYGIAGSSIPASRRAGIGQGRFYFGIGQIF